MSSAELRDQFRTMMIKEIAPLFEGQPIEDQRKALDTMGAGAQMPRGTTVQTDRLAGVHAEWLTPMDSGRQVILHLHGGGFSMGSCNSHRALAAHIGVACRARVLLPEYRQAPEHPFPAGLDDALAIYEALLASGIAAERIVVSGDSAGGNLALATLLRARERGLQMPHALLLLSPLLDLTFSGESHSSRAKADPWLSRPMLEGIREMYLGDTIDPREPLVSPLWADLTGLPPTLVQVGDQEILLSDSQRFAERATEAGVQVELEVGMELWHVWQFFAPMLSDSSEAIRHIGEFVLRSMRKTA